MLRKIRISIVLAAVTLAGCVYAPTHVEGNQSGNERIKNAAVAFQNSQVKITFGYDPRVTGEHQRVREEMTRRAASHIQIIEKLTTRQLGTALASRGIDGGSANDTRITLRPVLLNGVLLDVEVTVQTPGKPKWVILVRDRRFDNVSDEAFAQLYTNQILRELTKAGFITS